ncbi:hypothetical protein ACFE04_026285 [Oxalis oulophora]
MELNFMLFSPPTKPSLSPPCIPFSYKKSQFFYKPNSSVKTHFIKPSKTPFLGQTLILHEKDSFFNHNTKPHFPIRAGPVKRRKELPFDNVIQRDKKLKLILKIRKILVSQPERVMDLRTLGRFRRELGLQKKRRFIALLKKFPAVFEIMEEGVYSLRFKLTPVAERLYLEEIKIRNEMEDLLVVKLRKLLMMSLEKQILLEKIAHLRTDLGLPFEFRNTICNRYPQYFKVVKTDRGPALELTHWDPELAISAAELAEEENKERELEEKNLIIDRPPKFNRVKLPKGLVVSKGEMRRIWQFRDMPYISPYSDFSNLRPGSKEKEKHACAVVHEILSLTAEKRTLVDHLTHFREEFRFSQQLRGMLIRHPGMFYVSLKGDRDSVFLREAYRDSQLIDKDRLLVIKEKLRSLVDVSRFPKRGGPERGGLQRDDYQKDEIDAQEDENRGEGEDWAEIDSYLSDSELDDDDDDDDDVIDGEGDWNEEDDSPPNFFEDEETLKIGSRKPVKQTAKSSNQEDKPLEPIFPDGQPRERCMVLQNMETQTDCSDDARVERTPDKQGSQTPETNNNTEHKLQRLPLCHIVDVVTVVENEPPCRN